MHVKHFPTQIFLASDISFCEYVVQRSAAMDLSPVGTSCMGNYYVPNTYCIITYILCPGGTQRNHTQLTYLDTAIHSYTQL